MIDNAFSTIPQTPIHLLVFLAGLYCFVPTIPSIRPTIGPITVLQSTKLIIPIIKLAIAVPTGPFSLHYENQNMYRFGSENPLSFEFLRILGIQRRYRLSHCRIWYNISSNRHSFI